MPRLLARLGFSFALASSKASSSSTPLLPSLMSKLPSAFSTNPSRTISSMRIPPTSFTSARSTCFTSPRPTILSSLSRPSFLPSTASPHTLQARFLTYGTNYQPSQRKRKRKHGFLVRAKGGRLGRATLARRRIRGRRFLSH